MRPTCSYAWTLGATKKEKNQSEEKYIIISNSISKKSTLEDKF